MVVMDIDMPESCSKCILEIEMSEKTPEPYEWHICPYKYNGCTDSVRMSSRLPECPIKCDVKDLKTDWKLYFGRRPI